MILDILDRLAVVSDPRIPLRAVHTACLSINAANHFVKKAVLGELRWWEDKLSQVT